MRSVLEEDGFAQNAMTNLAPCEGLRDSLTRGLRVY
jgi:hypothetical protein